MQIHYSIVLSLFCEGVALRIITYPPPFTQGRLKIVATFVAVGQVCMCRTFRWAFSPAGNMPYRAEQVTGLAGGYDCIISFTSEQIFFNGIDFEQDW